MKKCNGVKSNGDLCRNKAGRGTSHIGYGYCYAHDHNDYTDGLRVSIVNLMNNDDHEGIRELIETNYFNIDLSIQDEPTWLAYAVKHGDAETENLLRSYGANTEVLKVNAANSYTDNGQSVKQIDENNEEAPLNLQEILLGLLYYWKVSLPITTLLLLITYFLGWWAFFGSTFIIGGFLVFIYRFRKKWLQRSSSYENEENIEQIDVFFSPVFFIGAGSALAILSEGKESFMSFILEALTVIAFSVSFGALVLLSFSVVFNGFWKRYIWWVVIPFVFVYILLMGSTPLTEENIADEAVEAVDDMEHEEKNSNSEEIINEEETDEEEANEENSNEEVEKVEDNVSDNDEEEVITRSDSDRSNTNRSSSTGSSSGNSTNSTSDNSTPPGFILEFNKHASSTMLADTNYKLSSWAQEEDQLRTLYTQNVTSFIEIGGVVESGDDSFSEVILLLKENGEADRSGYILAAVDTMINAVEGGTSDREVMAMMDEFKLFESMNALFGMDGETVHASTSNAYYIMSYRTQGNEVILELFVTL